MRSRFGIFTQEMPAFSDKKGEVQDMKKADIGLIGLAVMGENLVMNM